MTDRSLELQLDFEHPSYISMTDIPESLEIQINGGQLFFSTKGVTIELPKIHDTQFRSLTKDVYDPQENHYDVFFKEIPKQLPKEEIQAVVMETQISIASGSKFVLIGNFALNLILSGSLNEILSGSLNEIWSAINAQQLIILLPLCDVSLPANTLDFFHKIFEIAAFEIYPYLGDDINWLLNLEPTEPMAKGFEEIGFESVYIFNNMGTMAIYFIGYPVFILL